jgi:integrase
LKEPNISHGAQREAAGRASDPADRAAYRQELQTMDSVSQTTALVTTSAAPVATLPNFLLAMPRAPHECPATLYLANDLTTEPSRRGMVSHLKRVARFLTSGRTDDPRLIDWPRLTQTFVARVRSWLLEDGAAPNTVNTILAAIRGVLKQAWRLGQMVSDDYLRAIDVKRAKGQRVDRAGRCLTDGEVRALIVTCCDDPTAAGIRDAALFALAIGAGLRRAELAAVQVADLRAEGDGRQSLIVRGKGNKERVVALCGDARRAVADWLDVRGVEPGPLFVAVDKGGRMHHADGALCGQSIGRMMTKRGKQASVPTFSPHDCRRTFITRLLDNGVDINTAADLAGHANVETTRIYDRRGFRAAQSAVEKVTLFYPGRPAMA